MKDRAQHPVGLFSSARSGGHQRLGGYLHYQAVYNSFVWLIEQIQKQLALIKAPLEAISRLVNQQNNPPPGTAGEAARRATEALGGGTSGAPTPYTRRVAPPLPGSAASTAAAAAGTIGARNVLGGVLKGTRLTLRRWVGNTASIRP